ncbi:MAG: TRAP transporter large permease subunit [Geminicoccaceae bacterium]
MAAILLFVGFVLLVLIRVPISIAIGAAVVAAFSASEFSGDLYIIPQQILDGVNKASLAAVPFFIMAGNLMNVVMRHDRLHLRLRQFAGRPLQAELAQVNVLSSMIFAGAVERRRRRAAGLASIEIKAMKERGYRADFSAAITVCSSVVGPLIPPSIGLVIYAFLAQQSVERMFLAGLVPGVLVGLSR